MSARRFKKLAILHKRETVYGTDIVPAAADGIIAKNVTYTPLEGEEVSRDLILPHLGNQGIILTGTYARIEFDVELSGSGTAGTAPKYGSLLRTCGMAEVIVAATSVTYSIIEEAVESGSIYFVLDKIRHVMVGCRGNVSLSYNARGIPSMRFSYMGLLGSISDIASMPAVVQTGWITPVAVSKANTVLTLHGWAAIAESLSLDLGNTVTPRFLIGDENMIITDRRATGTAVVEARPIAEVDWFAKARLRTRAAMSIIHGTTAGNIVEVTAPAVEIGKPTIGESNNIATYSLPLSLCPVTGRDEMAIVVR